MRKLDWQSFERIEFQKIYVSNAEGFSNPFRWTFWSEVLPYSKVEKGETPEESLPDTEEKMG